MALPSRRRKATLILALSISASAAICAEQRGPSDASALFQRANYYRSALSKEQDPALAFRWMREAAEKGLPAAQFELGKMLLDARGASFDLAQAREWLRKAARKDKRAASLLGKVEANPPSPPAPMSKRNVTQQPLALTPEAAARNGAAAVIDAASRGDARALEALLRAGASVGATAHDGVTPLMAAAAAGRLQTAQRLLSLGADRHAKNANGDTAFTLAVRSRHGELATLLLAGSSAADLDRSVFLAVGNCDREMLERLLDAGAHADARDNGETPLMRAAGRCPAGAVASLLAQDGAVDAIDQMGRTALWRAAHEGNIGAVEALVAGGASRDRSDILGATPLLAALEQGHEDAALSLLRAGADLSARNVSGETPLIVAAHRGLSKAVGEALARGADPDARDALGSTALMAAARRGDAGLVRALLAKGADAGLRNRKRETAIDLAADDSTRRLLPR